jgi:GYF domain 2
MTGTGYYTVRLPDGTEYGPVDIETLVSWRREGRLVEGTLVWPDGSPEWLPVAAALPEETMALHLAPAASRSPGDTPSSAPHATPARPATAQAATEGAGTLPYAATAPRPARRAGARPASPRSTKASAPSKVPRALLLVAAGLLLVAVLLGALFAALSPWIARRRALADIQAQATPDRRFADNILGVTLDVPQGWLILRPDNRLVPPSDAKLALVEPTIPAFATLRMEPRPRLIAAEDVYLDGLVESWSVYRPKLKVIERGTERLAKGQGRLLRATWEEGGEPTVGSTVAFHDGWNYFSLQGWAPAVGADAFAAAFQDLAHALSPTGDLEARVEEAMRQVEVEAPELSRNAVRLLVQARMSVGAPTEDLPETSLRVVTRGLNALSIAETEEVGLLYSQVWGPLPEAERKRLGHYLAEVKAGRPVAVEEAQPLRQLVKAGVLSLPEGAQIRLRALNEKAIVAGLASP